MSALECVLVLCHGALYSQLHGKCTGAASNVHCLLVHKGSLINVLAEITHASLCQGRFRDVSHLHVHLCLALFLCFVSLLLADKENSSTL